MPDLNQNTVPSQPPFEEIEHTADWALRVRGRDLKTLLENAAHGMSRLLGAKPGDHPAEIEQRFDLTAGDAESLLVDWLSELAYWAEMEGIVFHQFEMTVISPTHLSAVGLGQKVAALKKHIKAVTYHNLQISETEHGLEATIVFDV